MRRSGTPGSSCSTMVEAMRAKYDPDKTLEAWEQVVASPPDHTGAGAIFKRARQHGWTAPAVRMHANLSGERQ